MFLNPLLQKIMQFLVILLEESDNLEKLVIESMEKDKQQGDG